jgi:phage shock protein A
MQYLEPADLMGMSAAAAKDYILAFITTVKLTEKNIRSLEEEAAKWKSRTELARSRGMDDLSSEAEKEEDRINKQLTALRAEEKILKERIAAMQRQLPGLAARERSVDADLLEQELLMALGQTEEEAKTERAFRRMEKEGAANDALDALKVKMNRDKVQGDPP